MTDTICPDWCNQTTDTHTCDGSHMRLDHEAGRIASGSNFPLIDERGAVFPVATAGIDASPSEGRGPHVFLFLRGPGYGDGTELSFPLEEAFGLAVDILDMYQMAIMEIDRPAAPWHDWPDLEPIVQTIEHNLAWHSREKIATEPKRHRTITIEMDATDTEVAILQKAVEQRVMAHDNATISILSAPSVDTRRLCEPSVPNTSHEKGAEREAIGVQTAAIKALLADIDPVAETARYQVVFSELIELGKRDRDLRLGQEASA